MSKLKMIFLILKLLFTIALSSTVHADYSLTCHCGQKDLPTSNCPNEGKDNTCFVENGLCYKTVDRTTGRVYEDWGCVSVGTSDYLTKCTHRDNPFANDKLMLFCCNTSYCNLGDNVPDSFPSPQAEPLENYLIIIIVVACIMAVVMVIIGTIVYKCYDRDKLNDSCTSSDRCIISDMKTDDSLDFDWSTSGSGSGLPLLIQMTISRQIKLHEVIGKGRYGEVYRGEFRSENVAVKKFTSRDEDSWRREKEIYQTTMLRHENILGFIAADNKDMGTWMELWLVSEYHENGSLFDYLKYNKLSKEVLITMARSIASGLSHLHMEIIGTQGKPPIAHCDFKSKNILVKKNLECAIADLGLAVRHDAQRDRIDTPIISNRVGTKRYMAPEVLDESMNTMHFDSYKRADIYGVGLVFWEMVRRANVNSQDRSYVLPYFDVVADDPSIEEMQEVVCDKKMRPTIYEDWIRDDCLVSMVKIMKECWYAEGSSRLTALNIKKKLMDLRNEEGIKV